MGLETAPFVQDFVISNPISGDDVNQGDNHLRLIKETLKATFPTATKAIYTSQASAKVASFSVVAADENKTFMVDATAGAVVATLPTLASGDHGWMCFFIKMDSTNTFHIVPASGSVYSGQYTVTKARRCIPGIRFSAAWSGSNWSIERCERSPIGAIVPFQGATTPAGYELPYGQTLASASTNYQEFYAANGSSAVAFDMRGRAPFGKSNMGGSDNGLLSSITGTTLGSMGGAQTVLIAKVNFPSVGTFSTSGFTFTGTSNQVTSGNVATGYDLAHSHGGSVALSYDNTASGAGFGPASPSYVGQSATGLSISNSGSLDHAHYFTSSGSINHGTAAIGGSDTPLNKVPPAIVLNFILVVE